MLWLRLAKQIYQVKTSSFIVFQSFKITSEEAANGARVFKSGDFVPFMTKGITNEGIRYQFLREEDGKVIYGKRKTMVPLPYTEDKD